MNQLFYFLALRIQLEIFRTHFLERQDTLALLRPRQREMPKENLLIISLLFMPVPTRDSHDTELKLGKMILEYP